MTNSDGKTENLIGHYAERMSNGRSASMLHIMHPCISVHRLTALGVPHARSAATILLVKQSIVMWLPSMHGALVAAQSVCLSCATAHILPEAAVQLQKSVIRSEVQVAQ